MSVFIPAEDGSDELVSIYDKDLNLIDVNENALLTFQVSRKQLLGKNICDLISGLRGSQRHELYLKVMQTGQSAVFDEFRIRPKWGNRLFLVKISKYGEGLRLAGIDITDKKSAKGLRWLLINGFSRDQLIAFILRKDKFYEFVDFSSFSREQLNAIALLLDSRVLAKREKRKK